MKIFWNRIYYNFYMFECGIALFISKIINFLVFPIFNIPFIRDSSKKKGFSPEDIKKMEKSVWDNPQSDYNITKAGIHMGGMLVLVQLSLFCFLQAVLRKSLIQYIYPYIWIVGIGSLILPAIINYHLLWKEDQYLALFKKFRKEPKNTKRKWALISLGVYIGAILLFVLSLCVCTHVL